MKALVFGMKSAHSPSSGGSARRKLSFVLPFNGQSFYLDIKNASLKTRISRRITDLGGQIEDFLSKDVNLLITDKTEEKKNNNKKDGSPSFPTIGSNNQKIPLSRGIIMCCCFF